MGGEGLGTWWEGHGVAAEGLERGKRGTGGGTCSGDASWHSHLSMTLNVTLCLLV